MDVDTDHFKRLIGLILRQIVNDMAMDFKTYQPEFSNAESVRTPQRSLIANTGTHVAGRRELCRHRKRPSHRETKQLLPEMPHAFDSAVLAFKNHPQHGSQPLRPL